MQPYMNLIRLYAIITDNGYNNNGKRGVIFMFKIDNQFSNANIPRTVRFTEKIFDELNEAADKNSVSFNMFVLQCCRYALDHLEESDE